MWPPLAYFFFGHIILTKIYRKKKKKTQITEKNQSNALSIDINPIHWATAASCQLP